MEKNIDVSIVIPIYNEEAIIQELYERTTTAISRCAANYEIICVDDGSKDSSLPQLLQCHRTNSRFKVISLARNFGHQAAVLAGLTVASGAYIGVMDGDLQDPPELFQTFKAKLDEGYEVVYGVRKKRKEGRLKKWAYWLFYRLLDKMSETNIPLDSGDFAMVKRVVLDQMLRMQEQSLYIRGIRAWVGFRQTAVEYERQERFSGDPKYDLKQLFTLAYNGIYSFSSLPIKIMRRLGYFTVLFGLLYALKVLISYFVFNTAPQGFTSLIISIIFFSGVQLISLGILGEYIHRIYNESRNRPLFIIKQTFL